MTRKCVVQGPDSFALIIQRERNDFPVPVQLLRSLRRADAGPYLRLYGPALRSSYAS